MPELNTVSEGVFTVPGLFTPEECDHFIALAEGVGFDPAPITTFGGPVMDRSVRNNDRVMLDDVHLALDLWQRVEPFVPRYERFRAVGVNERLRFYRYEVGQAFRWHRDGYFQRPNGQRSRVTYMVYLNDDFEGGHTAFSTRDGGFAVQAAKGMALLFEHHLLHQGSAVTRGRKYVLRTDVMYDVYADESPDAAPAFSRDPYGS